MKARIIESIDNPENLEKLYQENTKNFTKSFLEISEEYNTDLVNFWKIRLTPIQTAKIAEYSILNLIVMITIALMTGVIVRLIMIPDMSNQYSFLVNGMIVTFGGMTLHTLWQNKFLNIKSLCFYVISITILLLYSNSLIHIQRSDSSHSILIAMLHLPLLMWAIFGVSYLSFDFKNIVKKIGFIRYNGQLIVLTGLILIAGMILTFITLGLFYAIKIKIFEFYMQNIVLMGSVAAPIVASYLIRLYPNITAKIAPVIAKVFTPLALVTLVSYLITFSFSCTEILADRNLLLIFNIMLLAVLALIVFSISELDKETKHNINVLFLFSLSGVAIIINTIALFAIIVRLYNGVTPNRLTVFVTNVLIFINLIVTAINLFRAYFDNKKMNSVERGIVNYIPVYLAWSIFAVFVIPFIFGFK